MYTSESDLACYFADLVNEMRLKNLFSSDTTFQEIAEYSDERIALKEILAE
jgi:hypothetical protein